MHTHAYPCTAPDGEEYMLATDVAKAFGKSMHDLFGMYVHCSHHSLAPSSYCDYGPAAPTLVHACPCMREAVGITRMRTGLKQV